MQNGRSIASSRLRRLVFTSALLGGICAGAAAAYAIGPVVKVETPSVKGPKGATQSALPQRPADAGAVAHRAVYALREARGAGVAGSEQLDGRMVYAFAAEACDAFRYDLRLVTRTIADDGSETIFDARSEAVEARDGSSFRFARSSFRNGQQLEDVAGDVGPNVVGEPEPGVGANVMDHAPRRVVMARPAAVTAEISGAALFPNAHSLAVIEAAEAGVTQLSRPFFDGSRPQPTVFDTFVHIGSLRPGLSAHQKARASMGEEAARTPLEAGTPAADDVVAPASDVSPSTNALTQLLGAPHWPVTVGYFDPSGSSPAAAAGLPDYQISYRMHRNGVLSTIRMDYGSFVLEGVLTGLTYLDAPDCAVGSELE